MTFNAQKKYSSGEIRDDTQISRDVSRKHLPLCTYTAYWTGT